MPPSPPARANEADVCFSAVLGLDTNVLVRYRAQDDAVQAAEKKGIVKFDQAIGNPCFGQSFKRKRTGSCKVIQLSGVAGKHALLA
jgi:hypothetical protein